MSPHHHHHAHGAELSTRALLWAVVINLGLSVFEFAAGYVAQSTALMADALHNTNDAGALLIALIARKVAQRKADARFSFGYRRAELIGAMIQLTALVVVGLFLIWKAVERMASPVEVQGGWVMAAAGIALVVDVATAGLLWRMSRGSLNVRAAFLHNLSDAGVSLAVLVGGAAIYLGGWTLIDPVLTLVLAGFILAMGLGMLRQSSSMLMDASPEGLDVDAMKRALQRLQGVEEVHHVHVRELAEGHRALEAHIVIADEALPDCAAIKLRVRHCLQDEYAIEHATLELETVSEECSAPG